MIVFVLLFASTSLGLAIGALLLRALGIVFISLSIALLTIVILRNHGFGVVQGGLITVGSLTALQGSYLVGVWIRLRFSSPLMEFVMRLSGARQRHSMTAGEDGGAHEGLDPSYALAPQNETERKARRS